MKSTFQKAVQKKSGIVVAKSSAVGSAEGTHHSYSHEERIAFCDWINQVPLEIRNIMQFRAFKKNFKSEPLKKTFQYKIMQLCISVNKNIIKSGHFNWFLPP